MLQSILNSDLPDNLGFIISTFIISKLAQARRNKCFPFFILHWCVLGGFLVGFFHLPNFKVACLQGSFGAMNHHIYLCGIPDNSFSLPQVYLSR